MNKQVKAKGTIAGSYGIAHAGDTVTVSEQVAKELEEKGLVEVVGDSKEDESTPSSGSVRFADETNQGKAAAKQAEHNAGKANAPGQTKKVTESVKATGKKTGKK